MDFWLEKRQKEGEGFWEEEEKKEEKS